MGFLLFLLADGLLWVGWRRRLQTIQR
jgi:hypothetical protein